MPVGPTGSEAVSPPDPMALLRSRAYLVLLLMAALIGVPVSAVAFGFLALVGEVQPLIYTDLPEALGFDGTPVWWPVPLLVVGGLLVSLTVRYLPGHGGHEPTAGFQPAGVAKPIELPGIFAAALATLCFAAVLGPEAPLLALGGGLAAAAVRMVRRDPPEQMSAVLGAAGSFAAVSSLLGSPLLGAFLLMEASGLGGPMMAMVLVPGLLAAGIGALIFVGLGSWTGLGTYSLTLHDVPEATRPTAAEFGWALLIGLSAALVGAGIRWLAVRLRTHVERRRVSATVVMGLVVAGLAIGYAESSGKPATDVLYSGQTALDPFLTHSAAYSVGALALLVVCKGLAYCVSLSAFRGGPIFPAMFVGAAGGILCSHLPGLSLVAGFAMGIGAMSAAMLRLPLVSVLLATLLIGDRGITVMPLVIVAVVVSYVATARLAAPPPTAQGAAPRPG
ncbi:MULTISPECIES: chloride channel protein [Streptomyces]|uniref:Chloride channel protein n=1 Tax=Streptomyces griseiscabiei TaxID=2993540 RepID=A0ABU4L9T5_9ACTN|nr:MULTISPECIES: chloride channel protein [Streptomyces]MBZ3907782.1 chloride channel protein [Streptomyces griseiscabiei]MDX2912531.1 chloride channel protein [Streptomyces griseiscabiei]